MRRRPYCEKILTKQERYVFIPSGDLHFRELFSPANSHCVF